MSLKSRFALPVRYMRYPPSAETILRFVTRFLLYALVLVCPVLFDLGTADPFRPPKDLLIQLCGLFLLCAQGARLALRDRPFAPFYRSEAPKREAVALLPLAALSLLIWLAISALLSPLAQMSLISLLHALACAGIFWSACNEADVKLARGVAWLTVAAGWINSLWALLQLWGRDPIFVVIDEVWKATPDRLHMNGFIGNSNYLAPYLLFCLILSSTLLVNTRSRGLKITLGLSSALFAVLLILLQTFATYAGLAAVLLVITYGIIRKHHVPWGRGLVVAGVACVLLSAGVIATRYLGAEFAIRLERLQQAVRQGQWDRVLSGRLYAWSCAWEMIQDRPFAGQGLGLFLHNDFEYQSTLPHLDYYEYIKQFKAFREAHNDYLQLWAESGLIGLLLALSTLGLFAYGLWKWLRVPSGMAGNGSGQKHGNGMITGLEAGDPHQQWILTAGYGSIILAGAVNALANFPLHLPPLALILTVATAVCARFSGIWPETRGQAFNYSKRMMYRLVALAGLSVMVLWGGWMVTRSYRAIRIQNELKKEFKQLAELRKAAQLGLPRNLHLIQLALQKSRQAVDLSPWEAVNHFNLGLAYHFSHRIEDSVQAYKNALALRPDVNAHANLGSCFIELVDLDNARLHLGRSLLFNPFLPEAQIGLRQIGETADGSTYPPLMEWHPYPLALPSH